MGSSIDSIILQINLFQSYFDDMLEKLSAHNKPVYVMGNFNIDRLKSETCGFSHNFLLSLQNNIFFFSQQLISLLEFIITWQHYNQ